MLSSKASEIYRLREKYDILVQTAEKNKSRPNPNSVTDSGGINWLDQELDDVRWVVTLHNDTVHTGRQAAEKLAAVIPGLSLTDAIKHIQAAHHGTNSTLVAHNQKQADQLLADLRRVGLTVSVSYGCALYPLFYI